MGPISTDELHLFHRTHREVFCFLIFKLRRDLTQSLLVMALWIWLEHNGYPNISHKVMALSHASAINDLVDEAASCLKCLERENCATPNNGGLPSTQNLTQKRISLKIFKEKRYTIIAGIKSVLKNICARIFADVLQIIIRSKNTSRARTSRGNNTSDSPVTIPGFPHPLFGSFNINPPDSYTNMDLFDLRIWLKGPCDDVTADDKSMFLTFSRGFPVSEGEVIKLFKRSFGDCVENLSMGNTGVQDQSLFAIMILKSVRTVDQILKGKHVAKLQINRKHIWARKYERRD